MEYRQFGNTGLTVSAIGFGAWAIGGGAMVGTTSIGWGDADDRESVKAIHASLDAGINFFDTADIYGLGHSEQLLGSTISKEKNIIIATKGGNVARNGQFTTDYSREHLVQACEASLRRLKRDTIDYYQLHSARRAHLEHGECIEAMEQLQQEGKIRYWGLSLNTFDPLPEANYLLNNDKGYGLQLVLNLINQRSQPLLQATSEKGYGIIARMALQFGLLTGKFDQGAEFAANDHRKNRLTPAIIGEFNRVIGPVWKLCEKYQCNRSQMALSYVLSYPGVSTVIPGIRTVKQVEMNTKEIINLETSDIQLIEKMGNEDFLPLLQMIERQG